MLGVVVPPSDVQRPFEVQVLNICGVHFDGNNLSGGCYNVLVLNKSFKKGTLGRKDTGSSSLLCLCVHVPGSFLPRMHLECLLVFENIVVSVFYKCDQINMRLSGATWDMAPLNWYLFFINAPKKYSFKELYGPF